ncbi:MAG: PLP-dependent cysteine synthase family protein [Planctomycetota bacterium]|jgi:cysteine synthase A
MVVHSTSVDSIVGQTRLKALTALVGNTPLLEIHYRFDDQPRKIYAKYELMNMTGSVKDRMATHIISRAYESHQLDHGETIVEASSGNTGISFSAVGRALGHPVRIYMPNWMSQERVQLMRNFGAEVIPVSRDQGGFVGAVDMAAVYGRETPNTYVPRQFDNVANIEAHMQTTGPEIEKQLAQFELEADAFVAGVGTGGTVMGVGRYLRRNGRTVRIHPLDPANSPSLRTGCKVGQHRIQGISDEFVPSIVHLDELDHIVDAWDGDAILMAQMLCCELGLAVGISSGANFLGAVQLVEELGADAVVVTILPDSNKKYLSTDLCHEEPVKENYLTPRIQLERFAAKR